MAELPGRGVRSSRRPRVNYLQLLARAGLNDDPDTPPAGGQQRRLGGGGGGGAPPPPLAQPGLCAAAAADENAAVDEQQDRPAKRQRGAKATAQAVLVAAAAEDAELAAALGEAGAESSGSDDDLPRRVKPRQRRQRVLVDVHGRTGGAAAAGGGHGGGSTAAAADLDRVDNEYERQRLERIRRNEAMLRQLGVADAAGGLVAAVAAEQAAVQAAAGPVRRPPQRPRERRPAVPAVPVPMRKSARQRGERPLTQDEAVAAAAAELNDVTAGAAGDTDLEHAGLLDLDTYFQLTGQDTSGAIVSDGRFRGWVNPAVCERYGVPPTPDAAWEAGGGGSFSYKIDKSAIPSGLKGRGWSDARAFAHTQLIKNPNAYFYRHVVPHEQQAQGEWTEDEHALFLETARAHGVGDKWGLFASHLPQRVGYQCSAYYRDVIIPQGLVIDRRFKMTRNGRAVYVG